MKEIDEGARIARFEARLTVAQKALFSRAAALGGHRSLTEFVISSAQEKAQRLVEEQEFLHLSGQNRALFVEALLRPPAPAKKLKEAAARYKKPGRSS